MATLTTWMNNVRVGTLTRQANGAHSFRYDEEWLRSPRARPLSLSLPLQYGNITADAVYHYFDNLLPDSPQVRDRIVRRYQARSKQPFDLLAEVGRDSVGAVTLLPPGEEAHLEGLRWQTLDEAQLTALLTAYQSDIPLGMITSQDDFRISVAGAQEKTALLRMGEQWCIPQGATPTTHIIKLPIGEIKQPNATLDLRESVDNEYLCLALAREPSGGAGSGDHHHSADPRPGGNPLRPALGAGGTGAAASAAGGSVSGFWSSFSDEI